MMSTSPHRVRAGRALLALLALLAVSGCTACGATASVPEGFTVMETTGAAVGAPPGWTVRIDEPDRLLVVGQAVSGDAVEAFDLKIGNFSGDFDAAVLGITDPFRFGTVEDYQLLDERDATVAGADTARLADGTYLDDSSERTRQWDVFATVDGATQLVYLSLKAPESVFDEDVMAQILQSLEVRL
ncbi:hypothetical protein BH23ACT9_BH23ACT9_10580 [soil metagenome]